MQRPPVDANAIKGAGSGIWEEFFGYIGLGYRVLPANAIRQWEFTPTYLDGEPIDVRMKVHVSFVSAKR